MLAEMGYRKGIRIGVLRKTEAQDKILSDVYKILSEKDSTIWPM